MQSLAQERGYDLAQCFAYSDSASDLPMLEAVGRPVAVNPEPELRRSPWARLADRGDLFGAAGEAHVIARVIRLGRNLVDAAGRRVLASIVPSYATPDVV